MPLKIIFSICFSVITASVFAQGGFRPGVIINMKGDTLNGFLRRPNWSVSPKAIEFKSSAAAQAETFTPLQIKGFIFNKREEYVSYAGVLSTNKIDFVNYPTFVDTVTRQDTIFLRVWATGPNVKLLRHIDYIKTSYFIQEKNEEPQELKYYPYLDHVSREIYASSPYTTQLFNLLNKYQLVADKGFDSQSTLEYNQHALTKYVNMINYGDFALLGVSGWKVYAGVGGVATKYSFNAPKDLNGGTVSSKSSGIVSFGIDTLIGKAKRAALRMEVSVWRATANYKFFAGEFVYDAVVAAIKPQYIYSFYKDSNVRTYLGVGLGINIPIPITNKLIPAEGYVFTIPITAQGPLPVTGIPLNDPYQRVQLFFNGEVKFGVIIKNRVELYANASAFTSSLTGYHRAILVPHSAGINYHFGKGSK